MLSAPPPASPRRSRRAFALSTSTLLFVGVAAAAISGCKKSDPPSTNTTAQPATATSFDRGKLAAFKPLRAKDDNAANPPTPAKIALGKQLYFDKRFSKNQDISCASCHDLARYGQDGTATSSGHKKQLGGRNSPTTLNASIQFVQFWDGRAKDVEEQAKGPITNPVEMAMANEGAVLAVLNSIPEYEKAFATVFPGEPKPITFDNMAKAIGAYERTLLTPSPWDNFLAGDDNALTAEQKKGFETFYGKACFSCHMGEGVGGSSYQKAGAQVPWPNQKDQGRYDLTKKEEDRMMFKVPSLRNVAKTAPYFHDGSAKTLEEAVKMMGKHQLSLDLKPEEVASIVSFLGALTGEVPKEMMAEPELPKSTDKTPKPDPG
jgi:cytochrome c peroxidase